MCRHECRLLLRRQHHHAIILTWIAKGGENFAADSEIGVSHMCAFGGLRLTQSNTAKLAGFHLRTKGLYFEASYCRFILLHRNNPAPPSGSVSAPANRRSISCYQDNNQIRPLDYPRPHK